MSGMKFIRVLFVFLASGLVPFHSAKSNQSPSTMSETFLMGAASVDVTPHVGVPLAGFGSKPRRIIPWDVFNKHRYAHYLKPSKGVKDAIRSKALVIAQGSSHILFLSLDVVGVETAMINDIKAYAKTLGIEQVVVAATHTHSGPGAIGRNKFFAIIATDRFERKVYNRFLSGVKQSIESALHNLEPVTLFRSDFEAVGIQRNRRGHPGRFDPMAHLLYGKNAQGQIVGGFVNLAIHSTSHLDDNLHFSADMAGGMERYLTDRLGAKSTILFLNGAEGDVAPVGRGGEGIETKGREFAEQAAAALVHSVVVPSGIQVRTGKFKLPKGRIRVKDCAPDASKLIRWIQVRGKKLFPRDFELIQIRIGDILMMSWPGEPTTLLGWDAISLAQSYGFQNAWNLGLTNGYQGYFLHEAEYSEGGYEVCANYHGPTAGSTILRGHQTLFESGSF